MTFAAVMFLIGAAIGTVGVAFWNWSFELLGLYREERKKQREEGR